MLSTNRILLSLLFVLLVLPTFAINWVGGDGNWEDPSNWDTGTVPTIGDEVVLSNGEIVVNTAVLIQSLIVESSAVLIVAPSADLAIDPNNSSLVFALDVAGKVEVHGTVRRGGNITTQASLRVNMSGYWTTQPGGELDIRLGYLRVETPAAVFYNSGNLTVENNSFAVQIEGVLVNRGSTNCLGISASFDAIEISSTGQFLNYGAVAIEDFSLGIDNDNRWYNRGLVNIDDCSKGIDNAGRIDNVSAGTIQITNAFYGDIVNNRNGSRIRNWGTIDVQATDSFFGLDNQGRVDNYASGNMIFNGAYAFDVIKSTTSGEIYNHGRITIGNNNLQTNNGLQNDGEFINYNGGELLFWGDYSWNSVWNQNNFTNYGYCDFDGEVENRENFTHTDCGEMKISGGVNNFAGGLWLNESVLRLDGSAGFTNFGSQFINTSIIEDPFNMVNPANIDNQGIIAQTQSSLYTGVTSNFLLLGNPGAVNLGVDVYDAIEGNVVGGYDAESNKLWLEDYAQGLTELYFVDVDCEFWFVVQVTGGVQAPPAPFTGGDVGASRESVDIRVYPNPTLDYVQLQLPGHLADQLHHWSVYNSTGQLLLEGETLANEQTQLDLTRLSAGAYVLQLRDHHGEVIHTERLVKQ